MSDSLAITLHASAAEVASGSGAAVDLHGTDGVETRRLAILVLSLSAITGTNPSLTCYLDTSTDGASWRQVDAWASQTAAAASVELKTGDCDRYARVRWVLVGGGSATFTVSGYAHETYCTLAGLAALGAASTAVSALAKTARIEHLIAATAVARGYLTRKFLPPIIRVGSDVSQAVAKMASLSLLTDVRGVNPHTEATALALEEARAKERWLRDVSRGIAGADVTDSTPTTPEGAGAVATGTSLGWEDMTVV